MTKALHTPLPWHWWDQPDRPKKYDLAKLYGSNGEVILTMYGGAGKLALGTSPRDRANADFMLRACNCHKELVEALEELTGEVTSRYPGEFRQSTEMAFEALRKAKEKL